MWFLERVIVVGHQQSPIIYQHKSNFAHLLQTNETNAMGMTLAFAHQPSVLNKGENFHRFFQFGSNTPDFRWNS